MDDFAYSGLHAFVFVEHVAEGKTPRDVVKALRELGRPPEGPVMFAAEAVGEYLAFAHLRVDEGDDALGRLLDLISGELWARGVQCRHCIEADVYRDPVSGRLVGTKRSTPEVIGLVSIQVERGRLRSVLERLGDLPAFRGASVLTGDVDILLQLGGDRLEDVLGVAMSGLQEFDGIRHTSTALVDGSR
jgi:hypothetical protein